MWLVRTETNHVLQILGPFPKEKVCEMILNGELGPQDEVCEANHYWIYLHETDELVRQLGIQPPRSLLSGDEPTQTQTKTEPDLDRTDPDLRRPDLEAKAKPPSSETPPVEATTVMHRGGETEAPTPAAEEIPLSAPAEAPSPEPPITPLEPVAPPPPEALARESSSAASQSTPQSSGPTVLYRPMVIGDIEQRPSAWRAVLLVLLALAAAAIVLVIGLLRR